MNSPEAYFIGGLGMHIVFFVGYKLLRRKSVFVGALVISLFMAFIAYKTHDIESLQMKNGHASSLLYSPMLFLIIYTISRYIFKLLFKNEPIMASSGALSWEQGEYRKLHMGDSIFTVTTLITPILILLFI